MNSAITFYENIIEFNICDKITRDIMKNKLVFPSLI